MHILQPVQTSVRFSSNPHILPMVPLITWNTTNPILNLISLLFIRVSTNTTDACCIWAIWSSVWEWDLYMSSCSILLCSKLSVCFNSFQVRNPNSHFKTFSASSDTFVELLNTCWIIADDGLFIGTASDDTAAWGSNKCPWQNPEYCLQLLLPHWRSGISTGMGKQCGL